MHPQIVIDINEIYNNYDQVINLLVFHLAP